MGNDAAFRQICESVAYDIFGKDQAVAIDTSAGAKVNAHDSPKLSALPPEEAESQDVGMLEPDAPICSTPNEMWCHIASCLPAGDYAAFVLSCPEAAARLGKKILKELNKPSLHNEKLSFLRRLVPSMPHQKLCEGCMHFYSGDWCERASRLSLSLVNDERLRRDPCHSISWDGVRESLSSTGWLEVRVAASWMELDWLAWSEFVVDGYDHVLVRVTYTKVIPLPEDDRIEVGKLPTVMCQHVKNDHPHFKNDLKDMLKEAPKIMDMPTSWWTYGQHWRCCWCPSEVQLNAKLFYESPPSIPPTYQYLFIPPRLRLTAERVLDLGKIQSGHTYQWAALTGRAGPSVIEKNVFDLEGKPAALQRVRDVVERMTRRDLRARRRREMGFL